MSQTLSPTLERRGDTIRCRRCGHALAACGSPWKRSSVVKEIPTDELVCEAGTGTAATILRLFVCPGCGVLLDSETALNGEPFLEDMVTPEPPPPLSRKDPR
jgi:acetone carboxylase gamma subunit